MIGYPLGTITEGQRRRIDRQNAEMRWTVARCLFWLIVAMSALYGALK